MGFWTCLAQIANFLIFVALLYHLLYKPVGRIMKQRRDDMEAERRAAEQKLREAEQIRAETEKQAKELEETREGILKEARDQAEAQRKELLQQAEDQARERLERFRRIMEQERVELLDEIGDDLRDTIVHVAGTVLSDAQCDLADRALQRVETLLDSLSTDELDGARNALATLGNRVSVRSAEAMTDGQRERLTKMLADGLGVDEIALDVEKDPTLLAGMTVTLGHIQLEAHWRAIIEGALRREQGQTRT